MAEITIDASDLMKLSKKVKDFPKQAESALPSAINRTLTAVNNIMQKQIITKYRLKKSDLSGGKKYKSEASNNLIKIKKASKATHSGSIDVRGNTLTLSRFLQGKKEPTNHKGKTAKQIKKLKSPKVQVKKGSIKPVKGAFIQKANNTTGIFKRDQNGKLQMLKTLSVAQMASNKDVIEVSEKTARETLEKRIEHEIEHRLNKLAGGQNGST